MNFMADTIAFAFGYTGGAIARRGWHVADGMPLIARALWKWFYLQIALAFVLVAFMVYPVRWVLGSVTGH